MVTLSNASINMFFLQQNSMSLARNSANVLLDEKRMFLQDALLK
jgi:hypothetical protein